MSQPSGQPRAVPSGFFPLDARVVSRDSPPRWGVVVDEGPMPAGLVPVLWDGDFSPVTESVAALLLVPPPPGVGAAHTAPAGTHARRRRRLPGVMLLGLGDGHDDARVEAADYGDAAGG